MSKEDPTCKTYGYWHLLALPSNLKRVLILVHWKYVLLHNARKMCITHYSREIERLTDPNTSWQKYFCQNQEVVQLLPRPCLKIHSDQKSYLDCPSFPVVSLAKGFRLQKQLQMCSIYRWISELCCATVIGHFNVKINSSSSLISNQIKVLRFCSWHFLWRHS